MWKKLRIAFVFKSKRSKIFHAVVLTLFFYKKIFHYKLINEKQCRGEWNEIHICLCTDTYIFSMLFKLRMLLVRVCLWSYGVGVNRNVRRCIGSVVHSDVTEQVGHGFPIVDAANCFSQDHTHIHRFDLRTLKLLDLMWNRVGHHNLIYSRLLN